MTIDQQRIDLFRSLFRGRNDVFAVRWEKGNRSGYAPSCDVDPYLYRLHQAKGGTFSTYPDKTYHVLTDDQVRRHLQGIPDESRNVRTVEVTVKVPIENLIFGFGLVSFKYTLPQFNSEAEFEVENKEMRPEFEVLKPYFGKYLKSKNVKVNLICKIEQSKLKSYVAFSTDLDKINRELVEAVRFRFVRKNLVGKIPDASSGGLLDIDELQDRAAGDKLFKSGEELLDEILKLKDARHYHQLRYLAERHDRGVLKVRFVLLPFSFVFLLTGQEQYHIIWETLDTEEATYIWHVDKNKTLLKNLLRKVDKDLNLIRAKGRQAFVDSQPDNFTKILHDYSDERRGLIIWKDQMQSRLV